MDPDRDRQILEPFSGERTPGEIPQSLLSYFETSRSRADVCERLILEDHENFLELDFSSDHVMDSSDQLQINSVRVSGENPELHPSVSACSDEPTCAEVEEHLTPEQIDQSEALRMRRESFVCETQKTEERRRQTERQFELELRRLEEAEREQQAELELMAKRAQEKLELEMRLQQEMMKDLRRRVEEETRRRLEEQARFKVEQDRRRDEELLRQRRDVAEQIQAEIHEDASEKCCRDEREEAAVRRGQTNGTEQDEALRTKDEVGVETVVDGARDNEAQTLQRVVLETSCSEVRYLQSDQRDQHEMTRSEPTQGRAKQTGAELMIDTNKRTIVSDVTDDLRETQNKVGKRRNENVEVTETILTKREDKRDLNREEDPCDLQREDEKKCDGQHRGHNTAQPSQGDLTFPTERATVEMQRAIKETGKKKIQAGRNFNSRGKTGKGCENNEPINTNATPNVLKISQESGGKGSPRDDSENELRVNEESGQNVHKVSSALTPETAPASRPRNDDQAAILESGSEEEAVSKTSTKSLDGFDDVSTIHRRSFRSTDDVQVGRSKPSESSESSIALRKGRDKEKRGKTNSTREQSWSAQSPTVSNTSTNETTVKFAASSWEILRKPDPVQRLGDDEPEPNRRGTGKNATSGRVETPRRTVRNALLQMEDKADRSERATLQNCHGYGGGVEQDEKSGSNVSNDPNQDDPGPNRSSEAMNTEVSSVSIGRKCLKNDGTVRGPCCAAGESTRRNADETEARKSSNYRNEFEAGSHGENPSSERRGATRDGGHVSGNNEGEVLLNQASSCRDSSNQRTRVRDLENVCCNEHSEEVGLNPEAQSLMDADEMFPKSREASQDVAIVWREEQLREADTSRAVGEREASSGHGVQQEVCDIKPSELWNETPNPEDILETKKKAEEESSSKGSLESVVSNDSVQYGRNRMKSLSENVTDPDGPGEFEKPNIGDNKGQHATEEKAKGRSVSSLETANDRSTKAAAILTSAREKRGADSVARKGGGLILRKVQATSSEEREEISSETVVDGSHGPGWCSPEQTEHKRLRWMRECVPWSKLCVQRDMNTKGAVPRRRGLKRAALLGTDGLPPLSSQTLLLNTRLTSLTQLTTVSLQDLPGCSLSSLSHCPCLQSLSLRRCGLQALEHINKLQRLCSIDAQENELSFVDCENMSSLRILRLGHNRLSSIHGLDGADGLAELDLSHNCITRIAGVESLGRLQSLSLSHNQLISSRGVSALPSLLHLDLSHNQLDSVQGVDHCALLCSLHLRGNCLTQPPDLKNQVLLRELHLDDNSISSLHGLTEHWLPMMQHLSAAQNSLTELPLLSDCVSLKTLDLRLNCVADLSGVCEGLTRCPSITDIYLEGNPLQQEPNWRTLLQKAVPGLQCIDGHCTDPCLGPGPGSRPGPCLGVGPGSRPGPRSPAGVCRNQILKTTELQKRHRSQISMATSPLDLLTVSCRHLQEVFHLAEQQRLQHEFGETSTTSESEREGPALESNPNPALTRGEGSTRPLPTTSEGGAVIQQTPRASTDAEERGGRERAATAIQACWRGVSLRRRLRVALTQAQRPRSEWDEALEELDVDEFVVDEASIDSDWSLPLCEDLTERLLPLEQPQSPQASVLVLEASSWAPQGTEFVPTQAWASHEQPTADRASSPQSVRGTTSPSSAILTGLSERSEKIVEEWGFADERTALMMLRRARKMKPNREQKLKDPSVHLTFKSCSSQMRPTEPCRRAPGGVAPGGEAAEPEPGPRDQPRDGTRWGRSSFLPKMSSDILNGGRVQLVKDPRRVASQFGPGSSSEGKPKTEAPCPKYGASTPVKKERISFRDNKLQLSGGWGSGKRRVPACKKPGLDQD